MRNSFKNFVVDEAQNYPNCTTPWHESMLWNKKYFKQNSSSDTCDETEKQKQVQMDTRFIKYSLTNKKAQCKGINRLMMFLNSILKPKLTFFYFNCNNFLSVLEPCVSTKYEATTLSYDKHSSFSINGTPSADVIGLAVDNDEKEILFYYSTTSIQILTEDAVINFSNFVSAVGGNLGLFVGFSFLGFFSCFYKTSKRLCKKII